MHRRKLFWGIPKSSAVETARESSATDPYKRPAVLAAPLPLPRAQSFKGGPGAARRDGVKSKPPSRSETHSAECEARCAARGAPRSPAEEHCR